MNLNQIRYVYEVYIDGNITAAAEKLYVTQPSLSQQLMILEEELGTQLFVRKPRKMIPTPACEAFIVYAKRILTDMRHLHVVMDDYAQMKMGKLNIGMLGSIDISKISLFSRENPNINIRFFVDKSHLLVQSVFDQKLDVAFVISSELKKPDPSLLYFKVDKTQLVVLIPDGHPLLNKEKITFMDLKDEKIIMPSETATIYQPVQKAFQALGIEPRIICETSYLNLLIQLVQSGMGITFAFDSVISKANFPDVNRRPVEIEDEFEIVLVVRKDMYETPIIHRFVGSFLQ